MAYSVNSSLYQGNHHEKAWLESQSSTLNCNTGWKWPTGSSTVTGVGNELEMNCTAGSKLTVTKVGVEL